jgi:hypothetical protein
MSQSNTDRNRRRALKLAVVSVAAIPLASLETRREAVAGELPRLSEDDRTAKALSYVHDAAKAPAGKRKDSAFCKNCNLIQGTQGTWRGCTLFPGKAVNENGWCAGWVGRG